ncbi:glycosyltransferase family 4 protein [Syntrophobacter fumaroxidans]|uniref:Glycosyl transferase, group 1 n=1 Tax=Syntrophobacter fumaroxidans (strain DSM 10017 / MPOB) TaxID=335543 RepID=A0LQ74_SYNFM|nr:glycosyltransferase family 4 protein [Syntrophobacter fumaroxidans]ABK19576.1 glycosyl transferase, group 1 [Syntrophobacter fumaroxidans MPOB]
MKIALYCPNKPLTHPNPSGDLIIARGLHNALNRFGHQCEEVLQFRSRWFWKSPEGWCRAAAALTRGFLNAYRLAPRVWLTYHSYYKSPDVVGPWVSRALGIPYVLFQPMYGTRRRKDPRTRGGFYLNRIALKQACHSFVNNLDDLEAMRRIVPGGNITYLPPGIFPKQFARDENLGFEMRRALHIGSDVPVIMTAARFRADVKYESLVYLLHALAKLRLRRPRFRLLVAGDGPMESRLKELARELLPGQALFVGKVPREKMFEYYSASDVFAFPGIGESLGMVFLEAQACRLPVVALDTGGVPQVVRSGETGRLVPRDDGEAMAAALDDLLGDREARLTMGRNGERFIQEERNLERNTLRLSAALEAIAR